MTIEEKPSSRGNGAIGIAIAVFVVVLLIGIWLLKSQSSSNNAMRTVTYLVTADGGYAQIIYTTTSGSNSEAAIITTPFTKSLSFPVGTEVYLTASNPSQSGNVTCAIKIDGKDWKSSRGTHPVDSVACGGIIK